jgi:glutathione peroxidase
MTQSLYDIPVSTINSEGTTLADHRGEVLLVVNVASKCGLTPQYEGLERLYETYRGQKFAVLGFPANDFAGQEPGTNEEIQSFCSLNYQVQFPLYSKIAVTGPDKHPLYQALIAAQPETEGRASMETMLRGYNIEPTAAPEVVWNFEKFLIGRDGKVARRFAPDTAPDDARLIAAIEAQLAKA